MSINITDDGRRTVIAGPEWFPRADGMERAVVFQPGFKHDRAGDPGRDYGQHGMEIIWYLRGPKGAAVFNLFAGWVPGVKGIPPALSEFYPTGSDLGYHALVPQYEGQEDYRRDDCTLMPGGTCYYDGSGLAAERVATAFIEHGEPAVWAALESRYEDITGPGEPS